MDYHYINGKFVDDSDARISISDLGLTRGIGVNDVFRTYRKKPFHLQDHLNRLAFSAHAVGIGIPESMESIEKIIERLLSIYPEEEACIRTMVTGGLSSHRFLPEGRESLIISAIPVITFAPEFYRQGASVCTTTFERPFPQAKTLFYAPGPRAIEGGKKYGAIEAIYLNRNHELVEGLTSNFFAFFGKTLVTAPEEVILSGITRGVVLRLAEGLFSIGKRTIPYGEIKEMDEAFITSCNKEVLPVTHIDGIAIGSGGVGPHTRTLMKRFREYTESDAWLPLSISNT